MEAEAKFIEVALKSTKHSSDFVGIAHFEATGKFAIGAPPVSQAILSNLDHFFDHLNPSVAQIAEVVGQCPTVETASEILIRGAKIIENTADLRVLVKPSQKAISSDHVKMMQEFILAHQSSLKNWGATEEQVAKFKILCPSLSIKPKREKNSPFQSLSKCVRMLLGRST